MGISPLSASCTELISRALERRDEWLERFSSASAAASRDPLAQDAGTDPHDSLDKTGSFPSTSLLLDASRTTRLFQGRVLGSESVAVNPVDGTLTMLDRQVPFRHTCPPFGLSETKSLASFFSLFFLIPSGAHPSSLMCRARRPTELRSPGTGKNCRSVQLSSFPLPQ